MKDRLSEAWLLIKADKRKATALACLGGVLVLLGARAMLTGGPRRAGAVQPSADLAPDTNAVPADGGTDVNLTAQPMRRFAKRLRPLRDVFELNAESFPAGSITAGLGADPAKSPIGTVETTGAEGSSDVDSPRTTGAHDPDALRVRSVMLGSSPIAILEYGEAGARRTRVVRVGDRVFGQNVAAISESGVELEKNGVRTLIGATPAK